MHTENHILPVDDEGEHLSKNAFVHLVLFAWYESITHQPERVPLLAATVGVPPAEMLSHSIAPYAESFQWGGMIRGPQWNALLHGIGDCRVFHTEDGRVVEISFGLWGGMIEFLGGGHTSLSWQATLPGGNFLN